MKTEKGIWYEFGIPSIKYLFIADKKVFVFNYDANNFSELNYYDVEHLHKIINNIIKNTAEPKKWTKIISRELIKYIFGVMRK